MSPLELAVVISSAVVATATVVGAAIWTWRLGPLARRTATPLDRGARPWPRVSIIVPARNEEDNLPALLASLKALDPAPHEIIIVDDHSTDATGAIARAAGVRVTTPEPLPPGWMGKPWACKHGASVATGDLLLFTDADTVHAPGSLARAVATLEAEQADLVSAVPSHLAVRPWERAQGAYQLMLLVACRAGADTSGDTGARRFAIGQYLMFRREAYDRIGGHDGARDRVAEDLELARMITARGGRYALAVAPDLVAVRMYPEGPRSFVRGWRRSFRDGMESAGKGGVAEMIAVVGWLCGVPLAALGSAIVGPLWLTLAWLGVALATGAEVARRQRLVGRLPWWGAFAYPVAAAAFVFISVAAAIDHARRKPIHWRGRAIAPIAPPPERSTEAR
ncbi:MAG: glycosyltransferase [Deltaproteobacteria bacterium]|nr:glycosyltransferase [Deltaproteobacteria bacterium]